MSKKLNRVGEIKTNNQGMKMEQKNIIKNLLEDLIIRMMPFMLIEISNTKE